MALTTVLRDNVLHFDKKVDVRPKAGMERQLELYPIDWCQF